MTRERGCQRSGQKFSRASSPDTAYKLPPDSQLYPAAWELNCVLGGEAASPLCELRPLSEHVGAQITRALYGRQVWSPSLLGLLLTFYTIAMDVTLLRQGASLGSLAVCFPLKSQVCFCFLFFCFPACSSFPKPTSLSSPPACDLTRANNGGLYLL